MVVAGMGVGVAVGVGDIRGVGVLVEGTGVLEGTAGSVERLTMGAGNSETGFRSRCI